MIGLRDLPESVDVILAKIKCRQQFDLGNPNWFSENATKALEKSKKIVWQLDDED